MAWTTERVAEFKALYAAGHSFSQIAAELGGVTRHACIGKAHRLKLPLRGYRPGGAVAKHVVGNVSRSQPQALGARVARMNRGKGKPFEFRQKHVAPPKPRADGLPLPMPAADDRARVRFAELDEDGHKHCHWPVGEPGHPDFGFCGLERMFGASYCAGHFARSCSPVPPRPPKFPAPAPVNVENAELEAA